MIEPALVRAFTHHKRLEHAIGSYLNYRSSILKKKPIVKYFPPALMIEPSNLCNLKCPLCPSGNGTLKRQKGMMPMERFQSIVDQIQSRIGMLILWNQGEPFLNKSFYDMIEYATKYKLYTMTSTNASLDLDVERIVSSGLGKVIVSMDGIASETYNSYRVNGNYELVLNNLKQLVKQKKLRRSRSPYIVWQFIIMSHNEHEIDTVKRLAKEIGVDKLEFKTAQIYEDSDATFLPSNSDYSRYKKGNDSIELKTEILNRCRRLWTQPVVNWDGEMSICCYDKDVSIPIGNIDHNSFADLWFGARMNHMRKAVLSNRQGFEICRNCGEGIVQKLKV